jgi:hypothetical protein
LTTVWLHGTKDLESLGHTARLNTIFFSHIYLLIRKVSLKFNKGDFILKYLKKKLYRGHHLSELSKTNTKTMISSLPYAHHYKLRLVFFLPIFHCGCGLNCRAAIVSWFFFWNSIYYISKKLYFSLTLLQFDFNSVWMNELLVACSSRGLSCRAAIISWLFFKTQNLRLINESSFKSRVAYDGACGICRKMFCTFWHPRDP